MKSDDELNEIIKNIERQCTQYASGRLNGPPVRLLLIDKVMSELNSHLNPHEYDYQGICNAFNNPPALLAAGGYRIDIRITEKLGLMRTFIIPIGHPENFMSLA